jgi:hypothetical protein
MLTKIAFGLAVIVAATSSSLAATRYQATNQVGAAQQNINHPAGAYVATDPDANVRFDLRRDWSRGR